jgi:hypothetical protein
MENHYFQWVKQLFLWQFSMNLRVTTMNLSPGANWMGLPRWSWKPLGVKAFSLALATTNLGRGTTPGHGIAKLVRLEVK